jgi:glycosyltransferase involved in cell wall biosynthesis
MFLRFFVTFCALFSFCQLQAKNSKKEGIHFHVVIASYNNIKYFDRNLDSLFKQTYKNWSCTYINDNSKDGTGAVVARKIAKSRFKRRCTLINNTDNKGALQNIYNAVTARPPRNVIVILDGDDQLAHKNVLKRVAKEYRDHDAWLTYGSYITIPEKHRGCSRKLPREVVRTNSFRAYPSWVTSHLRTFYAGLFQKIKKKDFLHKGKFFSSGGDLIIMYPMLEMASKGHLRYIPDVLYLYNTTNPLADIRINTEGQRIANEFVRSQKPYTPLEKLFEKNQSKKHGHSKKHRHSKNLFSAA